MALQFTWDPKKAAANERKHGIGFPEAATAFGDPYSLTIPEPAHSVGEERCVLLGLSQRERRLVVVHVEREADVIRIIPARRATRHERTLDEEEV
ncbi:MAG: BrnT family toxin [Gemmatimonadota bacterium]